MQEMVRGTTCECKCEKVSRDTVRKVILVGGVPLVGPQEELRYLN